MENTPSKSELDPCLIDEDRNSIFPIRHPQLWNDFYKKHESTMWHAHEVDLSRDLDYWERLKDDERRFIGNVLGFFASSDLIVAENITECFMSEVKILESKFFYGFQLMIENIHSEMYSLLIDTYIRDKDEKMRLFNAVKTLPCVEKKATWAKKWISGSETRAGKASMTRDCPSNRRSFPKRLIAFAIVEGLFFSGAFCSIYWLKSVHKCPPGLGLSNDFISRDEGLHTDHACFLYNNYITNKLTQEEYEEIMREAVNIEIEFITDSLNCALLGINSKLMTSYIKHVSNRLSKQLGFEPLFSEKEAVQPFDFMNQLGISNKSNFFEARPSEYKKGDIKVEGEGDPFGDL